TGVQTCARPICRRPSRLDELADTEARIEDLRLEGGYIAVGWLGSGRNRILPDQILLRHFRPEEAGPWAHIAVGKLEPSACEGLLERFVIVTELLRNPAKFGVLPQRHVGRRHHRRHPLR